MSRLQLLKWVGTVAAAGIAVLTVVAVARPDAFMSAAAGIESRLEPEAVEWPRAAPSEEGLKRAALDDLTSRLAQRETTSFLVVRGGHLVYERYPDDRDSTRLRYTAALTKAIVGSVVLSRAVTDGFLELSDPARKYLPVWRADSLRSEIRIRDLAFHASGLEDVDFIAGEAGQLRGWKNMYYHVPARRFSMAVTRAPVNFRPGTEFAYSGVAYYALAEALAQAIGRDVESYLRERVYEPVGIPSTAWSISYGREYRIRGESLYAVGSGGKFTPRSIARIGQLLLDEGCWQGERLLSGDAVDGILARGGSDTREWAESLADSSRVVPGAGWWLNREGIWPFLPEDAFAGMGAGGQLLLVVPSEDLIAIRTGASGSFSYEQNVLYRLRLAGDEFFRPLMRAVEGPSSRQSGPSRTGCTEGGDGRPVDGARGG